jgi:hypothetical protein
MVLVNMHTPKYINLGGYPFLLSHCPKPKNMKSKEPGSEPADIFIYNPIILPRQLMGELHRREAYQAHWTNIALRSVTTCWFTQQLSSKKG